LAYIASRIVADIVLVVGAISLFSLIPLGFESVKAGGIDKSTLQFLATLPERNNDLAFQIAMVSLGIGSLFFCALLDQAKLISRFLAKWGCVGYAALLTRSLLEIFGISLGLYLLIPGGLFELVLPFWRFTKGFVQNNGLAKSDGTTIFAGDNATKVGIRGFLSFDLSGVPGGLSASSFLRATLSLYIYEVIGNPYTVLNPCVPSNTTVCASKYVPVNLDHVVYGSSLNATDYDTPPLETLSIPPIPLDRLKIMKDKIYRNDGVFNSIDALQHAVPFEVSIEVRSVDDKNQAAVGAVTALLEFTNLEVPRFALHTEGNEV
jgi:Domain of unknown function (DUF4386)